MLFKILQGNKANLPTTLTDGYCYYLRDEHYFYVDHKDPNGILVRSKLSAEYADKLRYTNTDGTIIEISPEDLALKTEMLRKVELTQAEYDALPVKDPNTLYIITDAQDANYVSEDQIGVADGVAGLDDAGKVPVEQMPPLADYGAAPAGYGLGETMYSDAIKVTTLAEVDALVKNGWYQFVGDSEQSIEGIQNGAIYVITSRYGVTQKFYVQVTGFSNVVLRRSGYNISTLAGVPWDWANPPMQVGVEYRTTERIGDKAVYKKNDSGVIKYLLEDETEWKPYANVVGAVSKEGDDMTGGLKISSNAYGDQLEVHRNGGYDSVIKFSNNNKVLGTMGFSYVGEPVVRYGEDSNAENHIYHTGNKPTAADIGAAPASHNQAASTITAGTFAGQVVANSSGQTYSTYLLRNTRLASSDTNPTVNGQICWTYG